METIITLLNESQCSQCLLVSNLAKSLDCACSHGRILIMEQGNESGDSTRVPDKSQCVRCFATDIALGILKSLY
jgi:hypothetical protein